jgi:hypothetical protein
MMTLPVGLDSSLPEHRGWGRATGGCDRHVGPTRRSWPT